VKDANGTWPAALWQPRQVHTGPHINRQIVKAQTYTLRSFRWDHLALAENGVEIHAAPRTRPQVDWEQDPRQGGATELRNYPKNDLIYLHRPDDRPQHSQTIVGFGTSGVTENNWILEDVGPIHNNTMPTMTEIQPGQLVRIRSYTGDVLVPNLDDGSVHARARQQDLSEAPHELWCTH
jgi:hypothetical protein